MIDEVKTEPVEGEPIKEEPKEEAKPDYEKSYKELQSKFNQRDKEISEARKKVEEYEKNLENWKKLGGVIEQDPELFEKVKAKLTGETPKEEPKGPSEERRFLNKQIVGRFEERYKINDLEPEKAETLRGKIGTHLQLMLDPYGTGETVDKLIEKIPLERLPVYFENAYKLATEGDAEEKARLRALEVNNNANGMIGSIPSSSGKTDTIVLTEQQREAARKLGVPEKDYIEYLKK